MIDITALTRGLIRTSSSLMTIIREISLRGTIIGLNSPLRFYPRILDRLPAMDNFLSPPLKTCENLK